MSHVSACPAMVTDLDDLDAACTECGLQLVRGQETYRWYGTHVGDFPLPEGFTADDLGRCEHAITVPGNGRAYEIGVCRRRDGEDGWVLVFDFWEGGFGMAEHAGNGCERLIGQYLAATAARLEPTAEHAWSTEPDGTIVFEVIPLEG